MTVFQAPRQFVQRSVSRHRPPFLRAQKLSFCFYFVLMIYRLGLNVKPDYLLMTALFIYPLPLLQIWTNLNLTAETRTKAEHLADGINPEKCFIMYMCLSKQRNPPFREYTFCNTTLAYVKKHPYLNWESPWMQI